MCVADLYCRTGGREKDEEVGGGVGQVISKERGVMSRSAVSTYERERYYGISARLQAGRLVAVRIAVEQWSSGPRCSNNNSQGDNE